MTKEAKALIGEATQEQIDAWATKYGGVHIIHIEDHVGYLRPFDRKTAFLAMSNVEINRAMNLEKYARIGEVALMNCWLGGSEEIRHRDDLYIPAAMKAGELLEFKEAELKKVLPKH